MFDKILIANRGEIASRIVRTCRRLGVGTVAVYSSADRHAAHVDAADEAVRVGASPSAESYLNIGAIVAAATATGAQAVHPGYGFLSENAAFAEACAAAGLVFVGPPPAAIRAMGSKAEAKKIMAAAGVPVMEGDPDAAQDDASLGRAAADIGYPVMVKPAMGGGGRGMRIVRDESGLAEALAAARREARSSFGDAALIVEKYLEGARHIEVQVFGDSAGNIVHLFERDCSVQRRHQKVIEEAPAPGLEEDVRAGLYAAAVRAAGSVGYVGAGTVEFLLGADGDFRFMEMNTRLQVEHPVTEMVTGIDLVEWQLRVAAGEPLPLRQKDIRCVGHAVEARLYAEDPSADFTPGFGRIAHLSLPAGDGIRVDAGVRAGDEVSVHYDPMIAKIVAAGDDRAVACDRLSAALEAVEVAGPATNERFLKAIIDHPGFRDMQPDTGFLARFLNDLTPAATASDAVLALAALSQLAGGSDPRERASPWAAADGWRLGGGAERRIALVADGVRHDFRLRDGCLSDNGEETGARLSHRDGASVEIVFGGATLRARVIRDGTALYVFACGVRHTLAVDDPLAVRAGAGAETGSLHARMPGVVVAVPVAAGDRVAAGAVLIVVEAMKVEHAIRAPADGTVTAVPFGPGDRVTEGQELIGFEADSV